MFFRSPQTNIPKSNHRCIILIQKRVPKAIIGCWWLPYLEGGQIKGAHILSHHQGLSKSYKIIVLKVELTKSLSLQKALEPLCESFNASPQKSRYQVRKSARYHHISVYLIMARHTIEIAFHRHFSQHEIFLSNGCFETEVLNSKSVFHIHVFHWKEPSQAINLLSLCTFRFAFALFVISATLYSGLS